MNETESKTDVKAQGATPASPPRAGSVWSLALFQKFYDFDAYLEPIVERFPTYEKSAWCARIKNRLISTMEVIVETNKARDKRPGWYRVDVNLEILRVFLRRMREKRYLSPRSYETASKRLDEVGKIVGGLVNPRRG